MTPRELIELQVEALFTHDAAGRLISNNEPGYPPAPRFFLSRSAGGNLWRVRHDVSPTLAQQLGSLAADEPVVADLRQPPRHADAYRRELSAAAPIAAEYDGVSLVFLREVPTADAAVLVTPELAARSSSFPWLPAELHGRRPCYAVVRDGDAVALCFSARRSARAAEAGVETLPAYRRRGYATAATAAWARAVRAEGLVPLYSTTWDNTASLGVARRLALTAYGAEWHLT